MKRILLVLAAILLGAAPALAQNPCTTPQSNAILPATGVNHSWAELPEHTDVLTDGTPVVAGYQYGVWLEGQNPNTTPPAQGPTSIPKTAYVAVAGFPGCYELVGGLPGLIPQSVKMVGAMRAVAQAGAPQPFSDWSAPSNPFSLASARMTPAVPGQTRVKP